ncbi:MAG: phage late control D family protein [Blastocatellia bacterium]
MPLLELLPDIFVPTFEIKVSGLPLEGKIAKSILDVSVTQHLNPPSQFGFRVNDPRLELIDAQGGVFTEGSRVEVSLGYVGNTRKMIVGEISALTADFPSSGPATLQVDGFDFLHRLTRGTFYRRFEGSRPNSGPPDSQIVERIASEMGLTPSVDATPERTEPRVQNYVTNLAFVEELARANRYFLWVDGETLYFKRECPAPNTMSLKWGETLLSFSPRLSTAGQVNTVEVGRWDANQKLRFSARATRSGADALSPAGQQQIAQGAGGDSILVITDAPVSSAQEAQAHAEAVLAEQQQTLVTGGGGSVGQPEMRVGTLLELSGVGRFDGSYVVEQVTHTLGGAGYQTSFQVRSQC